MPSFSQRSLTNLNQCHPMLQKIAAEAIKRIDFTVIQGSRSLEDQQKAFESGHSKLPPGKSKHNLTPSQAFDFIPCPFTEADWKNTGRFKEVAAVLTQVAAEMGVKCRWGYNWSSNVNDDATGKYHDTDHFELVL